MYDTSPRKAPCPNEAWQSPLPAILRLASGTPPSDTQQTLAAEAIATLPRFADKKETLHRIYAAGRIDTRQLAIDFTQPEAIHRILQQPIQTRMALFAEHAYPLAERVVNRLLQGDDVYLAPGDVALADIRLVVIVSSTGFVAPGLDVRLIKKLGLPSDTARLTVGFMGCAAAFSGLRIACDHVRANPDHKVLLVCIELSSVNASFADNMNDVITHSIFGDGCAAALIGGVDMHSAQARGHLIVQALMSAVTENTEDGIVLGLHDHGISCGLSKQLPNYIEHSVGRLVDAFLARQGLTREDMDFWAIHPGGTRIIHSVQRSLGLADEQLTASWDILKRHGNMLSPAVLFVLEQTLARLGSVGSTADDPREGMRGFALSFAPGLGIEGALLEKFPAPGPIPPAASASTLQAGVGPM